MNVFDAQALGGSLRMGDIVVGAAAVPDGPVKLGIRPEHLTRDDNGPFEVTIQMSEPLGANTLLHGRLTTSANPVTISLPGVHPVDANTPPMRFGMDPANIHLFDPKSGVRLTQ